MLRLGAIVLALAACSTTPPVLVDPPSAKAAAIPLATGTSASASATSSRTPGPAPTGPASQTPAATALNGLAGTPSFDFGTLRPEVRHRYQAGLASGTTYGLDPARSDIRIYAFRAGLGARFGHNHVITVPRFSGLAWTPEKGLHGATADVGFRLRDLAVDPPALRAATGGAFAGTLSEDDIKGTFEHLLGEQGFQAVSWPWIEISTTIETGESPVAIADVALTLHGETHHQRVPLKVQVDAQHLEATGMLAFRQGDYGVKPYAILGGLVAVDDLVAIEFTLRGLPLPKGTLP